MTLHDYLKVSLRKFYKKAETVFLKRSEVDALREMLYSQYPNLRYLTFEADRDGVDVYFVALEDARLVTIAISTDGGMTWESKTSSFGVGTPLATLNNGEKLIIKGNVPTGRYVYGGLTGNSFHVDGGNIYVYGNIMSLLGWDDFANMDIIEYDGAFAYLFQSASILLLADKPLVLPATTLANGCYSNMFSECTSLISAPTLPATTLATDCYDAMFYGCTSLTTAPTLPATTLAEGCYKYMFRGCTSLGTAPDLPATTLAASCYMNMFYNCIGLTAAPDLPATVMVKFCYNNMFNRCTSLTTAPVLPATTLAQGCYAGMFASCTSLTTAPELPATTLATSCYESMFRNCFLLETVTIAAINISASFALINWLYNVKSIGDFYCVEGVNYPSGISGIPSGWTRHNIS